MTDGRTGGRINESIVRVIAPWTKGSLVVAQNSRREKQTRTKSAASPIAIPSTTSLLNRSADHGENLLATSEAIGGGKHLTPSWARRCVPTFGQ